MGVRQLIEDKRDEFEQLCRVLSEGLERIFDRPVGLVSATSIRNPYFKQRVLDIAESNRHRDQRVQPER